MLFSEGTEANEAADSNADTAQDAGGIYVYVCGSVKNPGVYELSGGSRVYEAVELAGGFTKKADTESVNLAEEVTDGEMVNIPSLADTGQSSADTSGSAAASSSSADSGTSDSGLVNINTADLTSLMTLSGIGEVKAQAIIDYREENGAFASTEDIMNVSGIADATYANIKDSITV